MYLTHATTRQKNTLELHPIMLLNNKSFLLKATLVALLWGSHNAQALTQSKERELRSMARNWILNNPGAQPGDTVGALIRLGFHDAGTFNRRDGTGGAHACIMEFCTDPDACEFTAAENNGLQLVVRAIDGMYKQNELSSVLTKADFMHLFVAVGVEIASNGGITMPFRWGRSDCSISPARLPGALPDANWGRSKVVNFFSSRMGFSETETIALIGAHSVGRAAPSFSGFDGAWDTTPATLDNTFFRDIVNERLIWDRATVSGTGNRQWKIRGATGSRNTMMLNADVGLFWEVCGENPRACNNCAITHQQGGCNKFDSTLNVARRFANSNSVFLAQFRSSFVKLQELGNTGLKRSCAENGGTAEALCRTGEPSTTSGEPSNPFVPTTSPGEPSSDPDTPPVTGTSGLPGTTFPVVTQPPAPATTSNTPRVPREPADLESLIQSLLKLLDSTSSDTTTEPPAETETRSGTCLSGLRETDVNGNGVLDCNEEVAPCNPSSCPDNSVLCSSGRGCMPEGDMESCPKDERVACPAGQATCGDGTCVFWEPLCGLSGVRFPAPRCPA